MNEQAINNIMEGVIKGVIEQLKAEAPQVSVSTGSSEPIPVELSARHVHLSEQDALELFGKPLTPVRELSQPGQFLCEERVRLIGPKGVMDNVAVLGPARSASQVEISNTEARTLGIKAPVRQSGDTKGTPGIILASQTGIVGLEEGVIVAARHIHMAPEDGDKYGVKDNDRVSVRLESDRPVILEDVVCRVHPSFKLAMHIDPDEGNSAGWNKSVTGKIVK